MTDSNDRKDSTGAPDVLVEKRKGLPLVWLIPVLAAAIGAWLAYTSYSKQGPTITITFESASGLEPGKTKIKYRDVTLGLVSDVELSEDLSHVVVTAAMEKSAESQLRVDTEFWVENARVTASGVSGLGTLVSGAFIGVKPGKGEPAREFKGSEDPPVLQITVPGTRYTLHSEKRGSVSANSPIYYRGVQVGEVLGSSLADTGKEVVIFAFVRAPYDAMVRSDTRFWNAGGIDVDVSAAGVKVRTESVVSMLVGGISFDTPPASNPGERSAEGADFTLYGSYSEIQQAAYVEKVRYLMYFTGSVSGLLPGAPVTFYGLQLGVVKSVELEVNASDFSVRVPVVVEVEPQRAHIVGAAENSDSHARMRSFVSRGLRAQLRSGSLLTGALTVALDFFPKEPSAQLLEVDGEFIVPTVPSTIEQLTQKATVFLDKLADAPVAELVVDLRNAAHSLDQLLASPSLKKGVDGFGELGPLLQSVKTTSDAARKTLDAATGMVGEDSAVKYDLIRMLTEVTEMARSVSALTDYLENNPNSLIFGKSDSGGH